MITTRSTVTHRSATRSTEQHIPNEER